MPTASLFRTQPGATAHYLIETDPRFADYRQWLSSDYLLNALGFNPDTVQKRLGDGFYEQQLIREQIAQLTGYRYLDGYTSDQDEYTALMNAGVTFAKQYQLTPGIALTAAQMAQLTSDIVWLVEQTVTLPDGSTQQVLVPQVYVRVQPGDIDGSGALLAADRLSIKNKAGEGDFTNSGTVAGRSLVSINADNIDNLGGRISGGNVALDARNDINVIGGTVDARDALSLKAGNDINVRTTTSSATSALTSSTVIDRVAGLYVTNPGGTLVASAGNDVNVIGGILANTGDGSRTLVNAGRDINLGTVTESRSSAAVVSSGSRTTAVAQSESHEVGSVIAAGGDVILDAGHNVTAKQASVSAAGDLIVKADNDVLIEAGRATSDLSYASQWTDKSLLSKTAHGVQAESHTDNAMGSSFIGKNVTIDAGNDATISGSYVAAQDQLNISAKRDVNIVSDQSTSTTSMAVSEQRSPTGIAKVFGAPGALGTLGGAPDPVAATLLTNRNGAQGADNVSTIVNGSLLSGGSVTIQSGRNTTVTGSTVVADNDIGIHAAGDLTIQSAEATSDSRATNSYHASGNVGTMFNPSIGHTTSANQGAEIETNQVGSKVASLNGNVSLSAGGTYTQTASDVLALGAGADGTAGNIDIEARNVVINEAYDTAARAQHSQANQVAVGGSVTVPLYDTLKGINNTATAMGETNDSRAQALGAATAGVQAYGAAQQVASGDFGGAKVSVDLSHAQSDSLSLGTSRTPIGSTISGAGNVTITATGGGSDSNITATAASIDGKNVTLSADNAVTLQSAQETINRASSDRSSGQSAGVGLSYGAQNGLVFEGSLSQARGSGSGTDVNQVNTYIDADNRVTINSGGDTILKGAVVSGEQVTVNVGGNLDITSLQDTSTNRSNQSSSGFDASVCVYLCYGAPVVGSVGGGSSRGNGTYASVTEQSGIQAGDGGFDVNVKGNTNLTGGAIASTDAAMDSNLNSFKTGSLTMSDVINVDAGSASGGSLGLTYNGAAFGAAGGAAGTGVGGSVGYGSASGTQSSVTTSGISGIAGTTTIRTGDGPNSLARANSNVDALMRDVQAQVQITSTASGIAIQMSSQWGTKVIDLLNSLLASSSAPDTATMTPAARQALVNSQFDAALKSPQLTDEQRSALEYLQQFYDRIENAYSQSYDRAPSDGTAGTQDVFFQFLLPNAGAIAGGGFAAGAAVDGGNVGGSNGGYNAQSDTYGSGTSLPSLGVLDGIVLPPSVQGIFEIFHIVAQATSGEKDPSTPSGQRGAPMDVPRGTNAPAAIGGREYSGHALDQMQGRGVTPAPVEDAIQNGRAQPDATYPDSRTAHTSNDGRLVVITDNDSGRVITVITR